MAALVERARSGRLADPVPSLTATVARTRELTDQQWGLDLIYADTEFGPASAPEHVVEAVAVGPIGSPRKGPESGGHAQAVLPRTELLTAIRQRLPETLLLGVDGIRSSPGRTARGFLRRCSTGTASSLLPW